jgi:hypothetical protein
MRNDALLFRQPNRENNVPELRRKADNRPEYLARRLEEIKREAYRFLRATGHALHSIPGCAACQPLYAVLEERTVTPRSRDESSQRENKAFIAGVACAILTYVEGFERGWLLNQRVRVVCEAMGLTIDDFRKAEVAPENLSELASLLK